jgi:ABC-type branched-subunit amino acid transport system permease subunit
MKNHPLKDCLLIVCCLAISWALFIAVLLITNLFLVFALILLAGAAIYGISRWEGVRAAIFQAFQRRGRFALVSMFIIILGLPFILRGSPYWILILTLAILWIIVALGINIQFGSAGIINLGAAAFYGVGAYTAGMFATRLGSPPLFNLLLGAVMSMVVGSLLFIPLLKARGHYLALVTIAFVMAFHNLLNNAEWLGGAQGIVGIPPMSVAGYSFIREIKVWGLKLPSQANFYYLALLLGGLLAAASWRLWNSWVGLTWNAINEGTGDELSAKCMGVATGKWSMIAFTIGNFYIGLAGAFYSHMTTFISPPDITFYQSLLFLSAVILGGIDSIPGVCLAAVLLVILPEKLRAFQQYWVMFFGIILVLMLILRRKGLIPAMIRTYMRGTRAVPEALKAPKGSNQ